MAKSVIVVYKYFKWKLLFILYRNKSTDLQEVWKNKNTWILIRLLGEISITSDMQMTPPLWQKVKRNSKASGEGNGNPLQYSCLENPMDGGAWWATVHRVAKSRTQLTSLSLSLFVCFPWVQWKLLASWSYNPKYLSLCIIQECNFILIL